MNEQTLNKPAMRRSIMEKWKKCVTGFLLLMCLCSLPSFGQDDPPADSLSLSAKYQEVLNRSESYQNYKVIANFRLDGLWKEVQDSLASYRREIAATKVLVDQWESQTAQVRDSLALVHRNLAASEELNDEIEFLGLSIDKGFYNTFVWSLIGLLVLALLVLYYFYQRGHGLTSRAQRDFAKANQELEDLRTRSNERQVKLKRELQTALNLIEDYKKKAHR